MVRRSGACVLLVLALACEEPAPPPVERAAPPPPPSPIAASRPIADPAAFALVPSDEGALLVWGAPFASGGGIRALPLGPLGESAGSELAIGARSTGSPENASHVVEVDATAIGRRVGVAWIVDHGQALETLSAFSPDGGRSFTAPEDLGPTVRVPRGQGGRLSMAGSSDEGTLVLYHRIPEAPCLADRGVCARFTRAVVGSDPAQATRGTEPLEVRHPCEPLVAGALFRGGTWYYAVCHEDPSPRAMVYAIRPAVSYAVATNGPIGCRPEGLAPLDQGVALIARCDDGVTAIHLDDMGRELARLAGVERAATCSEGRPVLELSRGRERRTLHLREAADHLEGLLPDSIAPAGSRAVWTGEALLVAVPVDRDVSLRRYQCVRGDRFDRTDVR